MSFQPKFPSRKATIFFIVCSFALFDCSQLRAEPIEIPIPPHEKTIAFTVDIKRHRYYQLELRTYFQNASERNAVREIVGQSPPPGCTKGNECGETSSFLIAIKSGDNVVFSEEKVTIGQFGFSVDAYFRTIANLPMRPGVYSFRVDITQLGPGFSKFKTVLRFASNPRSSDLHDGDPSLPLPLERN
jgi:hypothetical protein